MMEETVLKNGKTLRCGYTTGTCAAAAAMAAVRQLLTGQAVPSVGVTLPGGRVLAIEICGSSLGDGQALCAVVKDGGDDPDATHGLKIWAAVRKTATGVTIAGGEGVGRVTARGLRCAVGEAAINPVPRQMICENALAEASRAGYAGGLEIVISAPGGEEIAKKTFNPRLGIIGGISILGTTGIVEPMSEKAIIDTIKVCIDQRAAYHGDTALLSPGNYGRNYCKSVLALDMDQSIKVSNYIGEAADYLAAKGFAQALLVGHVGKLVKIAAGIMNTHSAVADGRLETIAAYAAANGASPAMTRSLLGCLTTDEAITLLDEGGLTGAVFADIAKRAQQCLSLRTGGNVHFEIMIFTTGDRPLAQTDGAEALARQLNQEEQ